MPVYCTYIANEHFDAKTAVVSCEDQTALLCADSMVFVPNMNPHRVGRSTAPLALNLGTRRRWVIKFKLRPF